MFRVYFTDNFIGLTDRRGFREEHYPIKCQKDNGKVVVLAHLSYLAAPNHLCRGVPVNIPFFAAYIEPEVLSEISVRRNGNE